MEKQDNHQLVEGKASFGEDGADGAAQIPRGLFTMARDSTNSPIQSPQRRLPLQNANNTNKAYDVPSAAESSSTVPAGGDYTAIIKAIIDSIYSLRVEIGIVGHDLTATNVKLNSMEEAVAALTASYTELISIPPVPKDERKNDHHDPAEIMPMCKPPTYSGEMDNEACAQWIMIMQAYISALSVLYEKLDDEQQVLLIGTYLRGHALSYWRNFSTDSRSLRSRLQSAASAFTLLDQRFGVDNHERLSEWHNLKQITTVSQLDAKCQQLFQTLSSTINRNDLRSRFYNALRQDIKDTMVNHLAFSYQQMMHNMSYAELVKKAIYAERILKDGQRNLIDYSPLRTDYPLVVPAPVMTASAQRFAEAVLQGKLPAHPKAMTPKSLNTVVNVKAVRSTEPVAQAHAHAHAKSSISSTADSGVESVATRIRQLAVRMPKKGSRGWFEYCYLRAACYYCGQRDHAAELCKGRFKPKDAALRKAYANFRKTYAVSR